MNLRTTTLVALNNCICEYEPKGICKKIICFEDKMSNSSLFYKIWLFLLDNPSRNALYGKTLKNYYQKKMTIVYFTKFLPRDHNINSVFIYIYMPAISVYFEKAGDICYYRVY